MKKLLYAVLVLCALSTQANAACVDVSSVRSLIASGEIVDVRTVSSNLRAQGLALRDASVCEVGGGYVYRVVAEDGSGKFVTIDVDGRTGRVR